MLRLLLLTVSELGVGVGGVLINLDTPSIDLTRRRNDLLVFVQGSLFIWERSKALSVAIVTATSITVPMGQGCPFKGWGWTDLRVSAGLNNHPLGFAVCCY